MRFVSGSALPLRHAGKAAEADLRLAAAAVADAERTRPIILRALLAARALTANRLVRTVGRAAACDALSREETLATGIVVTLQVHWVGAGVGAGRACSATNHARTGDGIHADVAVPAATLATAPRLRAPPFVMVSCRRLL